MKRPQAHDLTPALGATITGVDLTEPLDEETIAFLRAVFDERSVLVFRDTDVDRTRQHALVEVLRGRPVPPADELARDVALQSGFYVSNTREGATAPVGRLLFHADGVWTDEPFEVLSLYAEEVGASVPATLFAGATRAWEMLPPDLRARLEHLEAVQVGGVENLPRRRRERYGDDVMQTVRENAPETVLPIVRAHPRTGRTTLLISENHAKEIVGLSPDESDALLDEVFTTLYGDDNVYAHDWHARDLVVWDNIAVHHGRRAVTLDGPTRTLRKVGLPLPTSAALTAVQKYQLAR
jgi:alpha-ketoglutarate-dependent taurine dioxygenase